MISAALNGRSTIVRTYTPWFLLVNVVVKGLVEDGQRGPSGKPKTAELLVELHRHGARGPLAYGERVNTAA